MRTMAAVAMVVGAALTAGAGTEQAPSAGEIPVAPLEMVEDPPLAPEPGPRARTATGVVEHNGFISVQVNVAADGDNISGDAANEPSLAVDPTAPNRLAIGWRQFDFVGSNFRQAGWAYSRDGGRTWTHPGVLEPGVFRSDPVLAADGDGRFYYYSLQGNLLCDVFISDDAGATWGPAVPAFGGDKAWLAIDRTDGPGRGHFYVSWSVNSNPWGTRVFTRSTDGGTTFDEPLTLTPSPQWGSTTVGPDGELYIAGNAGNVRDLFVVWRSLDAMDASVVPTFDPFVVDLGGAQVVSAGPNPGGLLGQVWIDVDRSDGPLRGTVYLVASVAPRDGGDPMNLYLVRSTDQGESWSEPVEVAMDERGAWQWFGTMAVAPNGRLDVVWIESLDGASANLGELFYASSPDGGYSWSEPLAVSPAFDSFVGWPNQAKLGDYYHLLSDDLGADLAWAATFNGEQDVYYTRLGPRDCNRNGVADTDDLAVGRERDCNDNTIPDSCELAADPAVDGDGDGVIDACVAAPRRGGSRLGG